MPFFGVPIRNGLPIGLGSVAGFGVQRFDPSELFYSGAEGAWYDPSDLSTLFQTTTGTTPAVMPGGGSAVPVGLMLDKSQGLVLGSELITPAANRDFSSDTGYWTKGAGVTISGGAANFSAASGFALYRLSLLPAGTPGAYYEVTFTVTNYVSGSIRPYLGSTATFGTAVSANGTYTQRFCPTSGGEAGFNANVAFTGSIDNVSIKQVSGNHAISYNTTTARPELSARVNLLTYSEQFDNAVWTKENTTVTANSTTDPSGSSTADALFETVTNGFHQTFNTVTVVPNAVYTFSAYIKANGRTKVSVALIKSAVSYDGFILSADLTAETVSVATQGVGTCIASSIQNVGNGWFRISGTGTIGPNTIALTVLQINDASGATQYAGDITKGLYIWGADLRPANIGANVPAYQRIADANTYDTAGFPLYLRFDGSDDAMYTPANLDLTSTDKATVFAGVRKLSDAATAALAELSASSGANSGVFVLGAPWSPTSKRFTFNSNGNAVSISEAATTNTSYNAPTTNVLAGIGDISGDSAILRVNGTQAASSTADQGTGNYGTYPLYIGARAGTSLFLNGYLYGLTVVGSQLTTPQIESMESWTAGKTGISIP